MTISQCTIEHERLSPRHFLQEILVQQVESMRFAVRWMIALVVLMTQSLIGSAIGACPATSQVGTSNKVSQNCPMGMKECCRCCKAPAKSHTLHPVKEQPNCSIRVAAPSHPAVIAAPAAAPLVAILPQLKLDLSGLSGIRELPAPHHLTVPRIRPPNPSEHGLRAPPVR